MLDPTAGRCAERSGFLFPHDCEGEAIARCDGCEKAICLDHRHGVDGRDLCSTCARQLPDASRRFQSTPFFYGPTWYPTGVFGGDDDPNDFTEADGVSTLVEGSDAFEKDLGAS